MQILIKSILIKSVYAYSKKVKGGHESGGILLGYRKGDAVQLEIVTFPSIWDRSSRTIFKRSALAHRLRALREWSRSGGTIDWVGEWHTHPHMPVVPSTTDLNSWKLLARHTGKPMIFLIFNEIDMFAGLQLPNSKKCIPLHVAEKNEDAILYSS